MLVLEEFTIQYPTGPWHLIVSILQLSKGKSTQRLCHLLVEISIEIVKNTPPLLERGLAGGREGG